MRGKVEQKLDHLQKQGIIKPVKFSDWATSIVPVLTLEPRIYFALIETCACFKYKANSKPSVSAEGSFTIRNVVDQLLKFEILTKFAVHLKFRNLKFLKYPDIFGYFCKFEVILVEIQLKFSLKFEIQPKNSKISNVVEGFCE